jgi:hypothetical protein
LNKILNRYEAIISSLLIGVDDIRVGVSGKSDSSWRLYEKQVGGPIPSVVVFDKILAKFVCVSDNVGTNLLHVSEKTGTARTSVEPNGQWGFFRIGVGLDEYVMKLAIVLISIKIT